MKYYVHTKTDSKGFYEVHHEGCKFMPGWFKRMPLGFFSSNSDAVLRATLLGYHPANGCFYCCKNSHKS